MRIEVFLLFWTATSGIRKSNLVHDKKLDRVFEQYDARFSSHAGTVVPECFKDDDASQWKSGKFDPRSLKNPRTDGHLNLHG